MAGEDVQLDELLDEQERRALTATIERSSRGDDYVRVTPFIAGAGCACQFGLDVKKDVIASLARTGETHLCCGKQLGVVAVEFANDAIRDVITQLVDAAQTANTDVRVRPVRNCEDQLTQCLGTAQDSFDTCLCYNDYRTCVRPGSPRILCPPPG